MEELSQIKSQLQQRYVGEKCQCNEAKILTDRGAEIIIEGVAKIEPVGEEIQKMTGGCAGSNFRQVSECGTGYTICNSPNKDSFGAAFDDL